MKPAFVALGELVDDADPGFATGKRDPAGVLQVRMNCVSTDGHLDLSVAPRVPQDEKLGKYSLQAGDVVFNATNSPQLVGKAAVFSGHSEPVMFSNHFLRLRLKEGVLDPTYLVHWLCLQWKRRIFQGMCTQWVNQASVRKQRLLGMKILAPPIAEQRRIAAILDKADAIRRKRRESTKLLEEFLRSVFLEMFGDPVRNPKGWEVVELHHLVDPARRITYGILKPGPDRKGGVPYIRVVDMVDGGIRHQVRRTTIDIASSYVRSTLKPGDLLMSIRGHVGRLAVVPEWLDGANITQDTARLALTPDVSCEYVLGCLQSDGMQHVMSKFIKGVAVRGINLGDVKELPVPLPPQAKQKEFARLKRTLNGLRQQVNASSARSNDLFNSLAQRAFRGEL